MAAEHLQNQIYALEAVLITSLAILTATWLSYFPRGVGNVLTRIATLLSTRLRNDANPKAAIIDVADQNELLVSKELEFPGDWYTSVKQFELEKRAIFSKTWHYVGHISQFRNKGDFHTFSIAGFSFFVVRDKDRELRAFHNVCRHRAYDVCSKSNGNASIFRCRYHGWTYTTRGELVHAPKFEDIPGFNKRENGLFEIRNWTDSSGFVYVNLDVYGSDGLTIRVGVPISAKLDLVENWSIDAKFNWKVAMSPTAFMVSSLAAKSRFPRMLEQAAGLVESWRWPLQFQLSPLTKLMRSASGDLFLTITIVPQNVNETILSCSLYSSSSHATPELRLSAIKSEVAESVAKLRRLEQSVADGAIADSRTQEALLWEIRAHSKLERLMGTEVFPASRIRESSRACKVADDLCRELEMASDEHQEMQGGVGIDVSW